MQNNITNSNVNKRQNQKKDQKLTINNIVKTYDYEFVKLSTAFSVPVSNIEAVVEYKGSQIKQFIKAFKEKYPEQVMGVNKNKTVSTVVFLKTGLKVLTDLSAETLLNRINEINQKEK